MLKIKKEPRSSEASGKQESGLRTQELGARSQGRVQSSYAPRETAGFPYSTTILCTYDQRDRQKAETDRVGSDKSRLELVLEDPEAMDCSQTDQRGDGMMRSHTPGETSLQEKAAQRAGISAQHHQYHQSQSQSPAQHQYHRSTGRHGGIWHLAAGHQSSRVDSMAQSSGTVPEQTSTERLHAQCAYGVQYGSEPKKMMEGAPGVRNGGS